MARFDYFADQGYEHINTNVVLPVARRRRERTQVAGTMAKIGYWVGFIIGCIAGASCGMPGKTAALPGLLVGCLGAAVLGLIGLVVDSAA